MNYPGGKNGAGVYQQLINLMPPHHTYVEPFLGSGAVMRLKRPAGYSIGIDADAAAVEAFRDPASSFSASLELVCGDAIEFLKSYPFAGGELVYADPPYLMSARRSSRPVYRYEMATAEEHRELLTVLLSLPCMVMVSGYYSELYNEMLQGWRAITFETMTRGGRKATEYVWMNYPAPLELHDYRYLGRDFRERERIKRKRQRWRAKLEKMPELERHAIMSAISELRAVGDLNTTNGDDDVGAYVTPELTMPAALGGFGDDGHPDRPRH